MAHNLTHQVKTVRVVNATVAGTTEVDSTAVDMTGFEAVRFVAGFGTLTAGQVTKLAIQESSDNSSWGASITGTITAAMADGDSNKLLITDLYIPTKRYVRAAVIRGAQNAVIDFVIAELYRASVMQVAADASVSAQIVASTL